MSDLDARVHCRFELDGKSYEYHGEGGYTEYKQVKTHAGVTMLGLPTAIATGDVDAVLALAWLAKRAAGEDVSWEQVAEQLTDVQALISSIEPIDPPRGLPAAALEPVEKKKAPPA